MKVVILTDLLNCDPAYSISTVVKNQLLMLKMQQFNPVLVVKNGYDGSFDAYTNNIIQINQGTTDNFVKIDDKTDAEIEEIYNELKPTIQGCNVVITHDLIYQAALWKMHVAAYRLALENPNVRWLHFVHSSTNLNTKAKTGKYQQELSGRFPNSLLAVFHREEQRRKAGLHGYEIDQTAIIPNPFDITEYYEPITKQIINYNKLWMADIIAVYPCRLDKGKQPEIIIEIFKHLNEVGLYAPVILADFHSTDGKKAKYRQQLKQIAGTLPVVFTSDYEPYHVPHKVIRELFEYGDVLVHPSRSESDPLIIPEAMWHGCGLVLNMDLRPFHQWNPMIEGKFSSNIDITTGETGTTETGYGNRDVYMRGIAHQIVYHMNNNPVLGGHVRIRKERSLEAVSKLLAGALHGN